MREAVEGLVAGRYRANRKIGEGAIGEVWEGTHVALGIKIAIKRLLPVHQGSHELVARFRREAFLIGRVRSEHVARVIDFVQDDPAAGPALIMEFIDGESLYELLQRRLLSVEEAVALGSDVLTGLDELHRAQVVHRDLKPGNIIIEGRPRGGHRAVLVDFGMGRIIPKGGVSDGDDEPTGITRNGIALGTLEYMAPEQILNSRGVTGAADLYALGAILFRALTGNFPFTGDSPMALVRAKLTEDAPAVVLARGDPLAQGLIQIVARALSRDLAYRYASADEMLARLNELRAGIQIGRNLFASSPAARPASNDPLPPLSIPPPPSLPTMHGRGPSPARAASSFAGSEQVQDDETLAMPTAAGRRPLGTPSTPAPPAASAPAMRVAPPPHSHAAPPMYGPPPMYSPPPPRPAGPVTRTTPTASLKVLGLAALAFFGLIVGGGLGLVYVLRREPEPEPASIGAATQPAEAPSPTPGAVEAPSSASGAPEAAPPPAASASQAPTAPPPNPSAGAKGHVVDLDDLPSEPAGHGRPAKTRGGR
jgi:eukaryotic-like serine/threonine-protein kinase